MTKKQEKKMPEKNIRNLDKKEPKMEKRKAEPVKKKRK